MELAEKVKERNVVDYDFTFVSGAKLSLTVDPEGGDTAVDQGDCYAIGIAEKPNLISPEDSVDKEALFVYKSQLAFVAIRNRKQILPSEEEAFDLKETVKNLAKGVH